MKKILVRTYYLRIVKDENVIYIGHIDGYTHTYEGNILQILAKDGSYISTNGSHISTKGNIIRVEKEENLSLACIESFDVYIKNIHLQ